MAAQLPLRDVHLPAAPAWWPPAPGWWWVIAVVVALAVLVLVMYGRRRRQRQRWLALFDQQVMRAATDAPARLAAASELLRRAARRVDGQAVLLQGQDWLRFLDGRKGNDFSAGDGRLLLDGGFRASVDAGAADRACQLAQARFLELMAGRR
jgi:hypothetical protein